MNKFIYKGGLFDRTASVAHAVLAHFDKWGIFHASPDGTNWGGIGLDAAESITAATRTLVPAENGKTILCGSLTGTAITLPAASKGKMRFAIQVQVLPTSGTGTQFTPATGDKFIGNGLAGTANQVLRCAVAGDVLGDFAEIVSNGVDTWHVTKAKGIWTVV